MLVQRALIHGTSNKYLTYIVSGTENQLCVELDVKK